MATDVLSIATSREKLKDVLETPLYANAIYLMLGNVSNSIFGFVFWIMVARLYTAEEAGIGSAIISAAGLLTMLAGLGFGYGLIRFLKSSKDPNKLINTSFTLTALVALAATAIFILGIQVWSPSLKILRTNGPYLVVFLVFVPISALSALIDSSFVAGRKAGFVLARNIIFNVLRISLPFIFLAVAQSFGIFGSWSSAAIVAFLAGILLFLPRSQPHYRPFPSIDRKAISEILHFSFRNYLGDLFWTTPALILPLLVVNVLDAKSNAYFYMAWAINGILSMIPSTVATSLFAEGSNEEAKLEQHIWRSLKMVFLLLIPAVISVELLADKLLLLFGRTYADNATTLLRVLAVAAFPLAINVVYFGVRRVQKKMTEVILLSIAAGVVTIGVSRLLLPGTGIAGIGIAWLISQSSIAVWIIVNWLRQRPKGVTSVRP
jgi:O-antigen/teichoic acid export membrane protein